MMRSPDFSRLALLLIFCTVAFDAAADIIYLTNGNIIIADKAWEEGETVNYQTSRGVESLPKARVRQIRSEAPRPAPALQQWSLVTAERGPAAGPNTSSGPSAGAAGLFAEALERLRQNLTADPSDQRAKLDLISALNSAANLSVTQGDLTAALASLIEALGLDKLNPVLLSNAATIHLRMGHYKAAEELLVTSLEMDKKNQTARYLLGEAYYGQEKISQAIDEWSEALQSGRQPHIADRLEKARLELKTHNELGTLQSTHFILRYDQKTPDHQLGQNVLSTLESLYQQLSRELVSQPPATVTVILYPDRTYFDVTRAASWTGALFDGKIRIPVKGLTRVTPQLTAALTHELTHSFIASLAGGGCPAWFNEGVAQMQEGKSAAGDRKALAELRQANRLIPLTNMKQAFTSLSAEAADVAYAESLSAVEFLASRFGSRAIRAILDSMAQNYNFENAFNTVLHSSVAEFDSEWRRSLTP